MKRLQKSNNIDRKKHPEWGGKQQNMFLMIAFPLSIFMKAD